MSKKFIDSKALDSFAKKFNEKISEELDSKADKSELFSGSYSDLTDKPSIPNIDGLATEEFVNNAVSNVQGFSGNYNDLTNKPLIPSIQGLASESFVNQQINKIQHPTYDDTAIKNQLASKADKSELFSGDYNDLTNRPAIPSTSVFASKTFVENAVDAVDEKFDGLRFRRLTQEQYDALAVKDPNTLYIVIESNGSFEEGVTGIQSIAWTTGLNLSDAGAEVSNSSQASYRTTDFIKIDSSYNYRIFTSKSSQFTVFYYNKNKDCIGHSKTVHDVGNNSSAGVYEYVMNGFTNEFYSIAPEDVAYIRIRTNSSDSEVTVEELGVTDNEVPYTLRNGWSVVSNTGALTGGSGAAKYMLVDFIELEPYYEYDFTFKGTANTKMYLYDTDQKWTTTLPSESGNYTSSSNTVKSSSFPEGTRYVRMRTANATVGVENAHEHLNFTKTPIKSDNVLAVTWIDNSNISSSTGSSVADDTDAIRSDYIAVSSDYYYLYSTLASSVGFRVFYYDTNKQFLSCGSTIDEVVANQKINMPSEARYIRVKADKIGSLNVDTVNDIIVIKRLQAEENLLYTFGLLSDVHVDNGSDGDAVDFGMSIKDYKNALRFLEDEGAEFIAYTGDTTKANSGYQDYEKLLECVSTSNVPNYLTGGNHDVGEYYESMVNPNKYYTVEQGNDIFVCINVKDKASTGGIDQQTVDFVRNIIESNPNKRIFVMYHYFIRYDGPEDGQGGYCGDAGGNYYTAEACGDNYEKYPITREWADLILGSPNVIFCHGHSHTRFSTQDRFPNNNYYHAEGRCHSIHVPSCAIPRTANTSSVGMSYSEAGSEGYIVKVFPDRIEFRAIDLTTNTYLTAYNQVVNLPEGN